MKRRLAPRRGARLARPISPWRWALLLIAVGPLACSRDAGSRRASDAPDSEPTAVASTLPLVEVPSPKDAAPSASLSLPNPALHAQTSSPVVLLAGGDIDLSRRTGQRILADATLDPFAQIRPLLQKADLRFANLESQLCELSGKTRSEHNSLVFAGPPAGALVLRRGLLDIVSTANNHAWDFGKRCAQETILHLRNAGIAHVGTSADGNAPMRARIVQRNGQRFAFLAVTGIFNDGRLRDHVAREYVADADMGAMRKRIEEVRSQVDWVIASVHVGEEYMHVPVQATRYALFGAVDAGADLVLGHHTHTPQRVEYYQGKPVVMSLGNYVFHQHSDHPWTGWGYLARVRFEPATRPLVAICPYHLFNAAPQPLTEQQRAVFLVHWDAISRLPSSAVRGEPDADGCVPLAPPG